MVTFTPAQYREKVYGGWTGKLLGRAAGAPTDGQRQSPEIGDYPGALSVPEIGTCEGVAIQRVWLGELLSRGPGLSGEDLARAWVTQIDCSAGEYGHAGANLRRDLLPPVSGVYDNPFRESLGAMARADLWGLVSPGDPAAAARYALQDAALDHAGAGVAGALFVAALVSAAFVESDPARLIEATLRLVPRDSRVARAVRDVARWHGEFAHWRRTREMLLRAYGSEDVRDSAIASGLLALALLDGGGDFGRSLVIGARCGWSAASVCGAAGAVLGAALGREGLPAAWRQAAGRDGPAGEERLRQLVDLTCQAGEAVIAAASGDEVSLSEEPDGEEPRLARPDPGPVLRAAAMGPYVISLRRGPLEVLVDYETRPTIGYDSPRRLNVCIANRAGRAIELRARLSAPDGFVALASTEPLALPEDGDVSFSVSITAPRDNCHLQPVNVCRLLVSVEDQPDVPIPIALIGESQWYAAGPYPSFDERSEPEQPEVLSGAARLGLSELWRPLSVSEPAVSLLAGLEGDQGAYYLATDLLIAPAAGQAVGDTLPLRPGVLRIASNDGLAVWLNGELMLSHHVHRPADPRLSADECPVSFACGWNRLVIKIAQCSPRRFLAISLRDPAGHLLLPAAAGRERA